MLEFTPLLLGYLVLTRRWRALHAAVLALTALIILCLVAVGAGAAIQAVPQALRIGSDDSAHANNQALVGVLSLAFHATAPSLDTALRPLRYAALLAIGVATALLLARTFQPEPSSATTIPAWRWNEHDAATFALALCALLLVSPGAWSHHYTWLLPANALVLSNALRRWRGSSLEPE